MSEDLRNGTLRDVDFEDPPEPVEPEDFAEDFDEWADREVTEWSGVAELES